MNEGDDSDLQAQRLAFERKKHEDEMWIARERLSIEGRGLSYPWVVAIGAGASILAALGAANATGYWTAKTEYQKVDGQIDLEAKKFESEKQRLKLEQQFQLVLRATEGVQPSVALSNLKFFWALLNFEWAMRPAG
jgi:hypothetical protein